MTQLAVLFGVLVLSTANARAVPAQSQAAAGSKAVSCSEIYCRPDANRKALLTGEALPNPAPLHFAPKTTGPEPAVR